MLLLILGPLGVIYQVHFRDIRRWSNLLLLMERISRVRLILKTVTDHWLLSMIKYQQFTRCRLDDKLLGFRVGLQTPSLSTLHQLLDENWLGESVIDTILD